MRFLRIPESGFMNFDSTAVSLIKFTILYMTHTYKLDLLDNEKSVIILLDKDWTNKDPERIVFIRAYCRSVNMSYKSIEGVLVVPGCNYLILN
jgi:hypothetical protein